VESKDMKILVAPNSFKGSLTSLKAANCIEEGIKKVFKKAEVIKIPFADGGDGTVESIISAIPESKIVNCKVTGPLGKKIDSFFGILPDKTAIIEMAASSGLRLVPGKKRNPLITTTYGVGELIISALNLGCKKIIVGIGGSATNDGGAGMAQAIGVRLLDKYGKEIGFGGGELKKLEKIDISKIDKRVRKTEIIVASDVTNPLCGKNGASYVYGPQKGATKEMVKELDRNLLKYARIIKRDLKIDVRNIPGSGAAGGLGAGLIAFCRAKIRKGFELIAEITKLEEKIKKSSLVITGEGKIDSQTLSGKAPYGITQYAKKYSVPVIVIAGSVEGDIKEFHRAGIDAVFSIVPKPLNLEEAIEKAEEFLINTTVEVMNVLKISLNLK
jgi:glycerate kinase